ncbi:MAG: HEAT repeat domain-containing protein [Kiritimatiellia bacterium]|jgi:hypothetical protein|nr:HEAT repeat domain-containing protein [Kiritimatiellia bacterium]
MASLLLCLLAADSLAGTKMVSSRRDLSKGDRTDAINHGDEATSFWAALSLSEKGAGFTLKTAEAYAKKKGNFYNAAFFLSMNPECDAIAQKLLQSRAQGAHALAAAALLQRALGDYLADEKEANMIRVQHFDADGQPINPKIPGRKGKGQKKGAQKKNKPKAADIPAALFSDRDPAAVAMAIQAAAYSRDESVKEALKGITKVTPDIAGAMLFYRAMIGESPAAPEVQEAFKKASGRIRGMGGLDLPGLCSFDVNTPGPALVCQAIGQLGDETLVALLDQAMASRDIRVRIEAARAMGRIGSARSLKSLHDALPRCSWPLLVEVCNAIGAIPNAKMVPALIQRLGKEKGRFRQDVVHALSCIAGEQKATDAKGWAAWWRKEGASFQVDEAASKEFRSTTRVQDVDVPGLGFFYGLQIVSDSFSYVVDSSASMRGPRIDSLKENMTSSVEGLAEHVKFNIVDFGGDVEIMYDGALTGNKKLGKQRVYDMDMSGGTRVFCGMRQAMLLPELDTIYLLSDGAPVLDSMHRWPEIIRATMMLGRYRPVAVYCIDFDPRAGNQAYMMRLADENVGLHESINVGPPARVGAQKKKKK